MIGASSPRSRPYRDSHARWNPRCASAAT
jgi:hypothetical protein